jgi:hypothetical protein
MGHLGELGKARVNTDTFGWFGNVIRVGPSFTSLRLIGFMEVAATIEDSNEVEAMKAVHDFLHSLVHEDDWDVFWKSSIDNGQTVEDLLDLMQVLTANEADRPTRRRSGSSAGRRKTVAKSKEDSSTPVTLRLARQGRPDLAMIAEQAELARGAQRAG